MGTTATDVVMDRSGIAGHPRGLSTLFFTEMWERFSYYGMRAFLLLYLVASLADGGMGLDTMTAASIYGLYTGGVYFMSIPGGWVADKLLGPRRAVLWGGILIALGHYSLALNMRPLFFGGLVLIVLGTGLLKANAAVVVGQLYGPGDPRRDAGFSIFYMGINLGALFAPLICGSLAQRVGWHWGFGAAGVFMTAGLIQYVLGANRLGNAGLLTQRPVNAPRLWLQVIAVLAAIFAILFLIPKWGTWVLLALLAVVAFLWVSRQGFTAEEKKRIGAIFALFLFATIFWSGFEQAGSSLNLFGDRLTRNNVLGWGFPSSWWQSVQPVFIIIFAPVFAWLWIRLGRREPSSPAKFVYGLMLMAVSYTVLASAAAASGPEAARVSPWWLVVVYLLHAWGELALSPVGMSTVTKLAPDKVVGQMMGVWYLSISLGNLIGSKVAGLFDTFPLPQLFGTVAATIGVAGLALLALVPAIRRLMGGVK